MKDSDKSTFRLFISVILVIALFWVLLEREPTWEVTLDESEIVLVKKSWFGIKREEFPMKKRGGQWYYRVRNKQTQKYEWIEFINYADFAPDVPPYEGIR